MDTTNLKAVPDAPETLEQKIAKMQKQLDTFIANANREVARLSGKIEMAQEILASQKEVSPDAD